MGRTDSFAEVWILDESNERIRRKVKLEDERKTIISVLERDFARETESLPIRDQICKPTSVSLSHRVRQAKDNLLMNTEIFIECEKLSKSYKKGRNTITPLEDLDLEVSKESSGPDGTIGFGKTTLLNLIAGIDQPTSGR